MTFLFYLKSCRFGNFLCFLQHLTQRTKRSWGVWVDLDLNFYRQLHSPSLIWAQGCHKLRVCFVPRQFLEDRFAKKSQLSFENTLTPLTGTLSSKYHNTKYSPWNISIERKKDTHFFSVITVMLIRYDNWNDTSFLSVYTKKQTRWTLPLQSIFCIVLAIYVIHNSFIWQTCKNYFVHFGVSLRI